MSRQPQRSSAGIPTQAGSTWRRSTGVDVAVNLGGVPVAPLPWTESRREQILASRVNTTSTMARGFAAHADGRPRTLIQASGIARYGTTSESEPYTEESPAAGDYLAQVTTKWEAAAQPAADAGVRVVILRTSPVMDTSGGTFALLKLPWLSVSVRRSATAANGCP